jgi:hypothetical protein
VSKLGDSFLDHMWEEDDLLNQPYGPADEYSELRSALRTKHCTADRKEFSWTRVGCLFVIAIALLLLALAYNSVGSH